MEFNDGDIIIRIYKSGREAIGLYNIGKRYDKIIYLGETFNRDGGLTQFDSYSLGNDYEYKLATNFEVNLLHKDIRNKLLELNNFQINFQSFEYYEKYLREYISKIRKNKLIKLRENNEKI